LVTGKIEDGLIDLTSMKSDSLRIMDYVKENNTFSFPSKDIEKL
jgi:hypothetical protein